MCLSLYISTCLLEKNLAKIIIKTIVVIPIGSKEKLPILYQLFTPLISEAKKNNPTKSKLQTRYKTNTK